MTTTRARWPDELEDLPVEIELLEAVWEESQRNSEYFNAREQELWEQYPGKCLLIHSGSVVEAFDEYSALVGRYEELEPVARGGSIACWQMTGIWIL